MICEEIAEKVPNRIPPKAIKAITARSTLYDSLDRAKKALAARAMTAEDARAWLDLDDLQCELPARKIRQCEACDGGGENPPQCPRAATTGRYCAEHYEE